MKRAIFVVLLFCVGAVTSSAQATDSETFRVYDANGNVSSLDAIIKALDGVDVVFLGEQHDDTIAHGVQLEVFRRALSEYAAKRKIVLSMEMFERDVQTIVDEYLKGQITENHFLLSSRPWSNYKADYRPLVELAKEKGLPVIAANAPRRYVNMVSRNGRDSLNGLSKDAKKWLAPLPYAEPSETYAKKFKALMGPSPEAQMGIDKILASQSLWDATMANSVAEFLKKNKKPLVIHLNGAFHTENRLGTVEHLLKYRPKTKVLVVTMRYEDDYKTFDKSKHTGLGDFVILTRRKTNVGVLSEILRRVEIHDRSLRSLKADVTLVKTNQQLNVSDTFSGRLRYLPKQEATRNRLYLRLDWLKPVEEQLSMIGLDFELYRPRINQVLQGNLKSSPTKEWFNLMDMSRDQFKRNHSIEYLGEEQISNGAKTWHLRIVPKNETLYKTFEVWIDAEGMPQQIKLTESNNDTATLLFSNIEKNVKMEGDAFLLKYPSTIKRMKL